MQWFETGKKNCPQCRHRANENSLRRVYLSETDGDTTVDSDNLQNMLDSAKFTIRCKETEREKLSVKNAELEKQHKGMKDEVKKLELEVQKQKDSAAGYKSQVRFLQQERARFEEAKQEAAQLRAKLDNYKAVEMVVKGAEGDVNLMLAERGAWDGKSRDMATLVVTLKQKLVDVKRERGAAEARAREAAGSLETMKRSLLQVKKVLAENEEKNRNMEADVRHLEEENGRMRRLERKRDEFDRLVVDEEEADDGSCSPKPCSPDMYSSPDKSVPGPKYKVLGVKRVHSDDTEEEADNFSPQLKSCGILGMRKPLAEISKKQRLLPVSSTTSHPRLLSSSQPTLSRSNTLGSLGGFGGRGKMDEFPRPNSDFEISKPKHPSVKKTSSLLRNKNKSNQLKTIDRFFGGLDSP